MHQRFRRIIAAVVVILLASTLLSVPADARIYETTEVELSVPGAAFGLGDVWFGEFNKPGIVSWGDGAANSPHLVAGGHVAVNDFWAGGCATLRVRAMSPTQVLSTRSVRHCAPPMSVLIDPVNGLFGFDDTRIRHVEICLSVDGGGRDCAFETRPYVPHRFLIAEYVR